MKVEKQAQSINNDEKANERVSQPEPESDINKENWVINRFFNLLTLVCYIGTGLMIFKYEKYWQTRIVHKPKDYEIPKLSDFKITLYCLPFFILVKVLFEKYVSNLMYIILSNKYKNKEDGENFKTGEIYKRKLATGAFKVFYYSLAVVLGHIFLKNMSFFPYELLGNGDMANMFTGVPDYLFFDKPAYFNYYYLGALAFVLTDLIWLLFIYDNQTDFPLMLLHHSITISLVMFSYLTNLSQIGVIVFYLHDITDIFVYVVRIVINTDVRDMFKVIPCTALLTSYLYFRIYVFGKLIYLVYYNLNDWNSYSYTLWIFKCILMIMHIYWVTAIIKRFLFYKIEDVGKVKKK